jgi:hypothetical protein
MRNDHVSNKILLKIEELTKPLSKLPKTWNDHLAKVREFAYKGVSKSFPTGHLEQEL